MPSCPERHAGVLLPLSVIPPHGTLGDETLRTLDWMHHCGMTRWQILPLNPPDAHGSPYNSPSGFALAPQLLDTTVLAQWGLPLTTGHANTPGTDRHAPLADWLHDSRHSTHTLATAFAHFQHHHRQWLEDHALFMSLREIHGSPWTAWPTLLRDRHPPALREFSAAHHSKIEAIMFEQCLIWQQWRRVHSYARHLGLRVIGDLPIHVAWDSVDCWMHRALFQLDEAGHPTRVAGAPPDRFNPEGQRWGMPAHRWDRHQASGFHWWNRRLEHLMSLVDIVRLDHFLGLVHSWSIPADHATATAGRWHDVPGDALLQSWQSRWAPLPLIAEDLGAITPDVIAMRDRYGLPGMHVLQFAFDGDPDNLHLPHHHVRHSIACTGTHDTPTVRGWLDTLSDNARQRVADYFHQPAIPLQEALVRATLASVAATAIIPVQDWLGLGTEARLNTPGITAGQWAWQLGMDLLDADHVLQIRHWLNLYGRLGQH